MQRTTNYLLGIDIGGTHVTVGLISLADHSLVVPSLFRKRVDSKGAASDIIDTWVDAIREIDAFHPGSYEHIGIAMPGPFDYDDGISLITGFDKYESLYGLNVRRLLAERLGLQDTSIRFKNDAAAFLEGEVLAGAGKGYTNCIGVTLGTGLGTAWSLDGFTADAERSVLSFHQGIAEDYLSTRWFVQRYRELSGETVCDTKELAGRYERSATVRQVFREFSDNLAVFLGDFIREREPQLLVIGGNMAKAAGLFLPQATQRLNGVTKHTEIRLANLGETAALIGGAGCWKDEYALIP